MCAGCVGMVKFGGRKLWSRSSGGLSCEIDGEIWGEVLRTRDERLDGFGNLGSVAGGKVKHARHDEFVGEAWDVK